jgi:L-2,4-diaminobutyrate decarboxylase
MDKVITYKDIVDGISKSVPANGLQSVPDIEALIHQAFGALPVTAPNDIYLGGEPTPSEFPEIESWAGFSLNGMDPAQVLAAALSVFRGIPLWHSPEIMLNVQPPVMKAAIAAAAVVTMMNSNMIWDHASGQAHKLEDQIFRHVGRLAQWDEATVGGVFTYGGKGCLAYAVRTGLNRCSPGVSSKGFGINDKHPVVITSETSHYCIESICAQHNMGSVNVVRIPINNDGTINLEAYEKKLDELMGAGIPIAAIIASGGDTLNMAVDSPKAMREISRKVAAKHNLDYEPFLYLDTVVGWPWLTYANYDWQENPLKIPAALRERLESLGNTLGETAWCDAIGCDFHKIGFAPTTSSAFLIRNGAELQSIFKDKVAETQRNAYGQNFFQHASFEHSKSALPVVASWITLQTLGVNGLRAYLARMTEIGDLFRAELSRYGLELINQAGKGWAGVYWLNSKDGPKTYDDLLKAPDQAIADSNRRIANLERYLALGYDGGQRVLLRWIPQYRVPHSKRTAATLVVYPMAPSTTDEDVKRIAARIGEVAQKIAGTPAAKLPFTADMKHVPK